MKYLSSIPGWIYPARLLLLILFLSAPAGRVHAADISQAQAMVEDTTKSVLDVLQKNQEQLKNDKPALYRLVNDIVVPHFDFDVMARLVLGKHWRDASGEQRKQFSGEFKTLLVRTYSTAMLNFTNQDIKFLPIRGDGEDNTKAISRMEINQPGGGPPAQMHLRMIFRNGSWMIYDITVDGVSLVTNYRQSFNNDVVQIGIDGLIEKLVEKNKQKSG